METGFYEKYSRIWSYPVVDGEVFGDMVLGGPVPCEEDDELSSDRLWRGEQGNARAEVWKYLGRILRRECYDLMRVH